MRTIEDHKTNECNEAITIEADERDPNIGPSHNYGLTYRDKYGRLEGFKLRFQHGPIKEVGTNGITNEALLAVLIDRMRGFQDGPYACDENQYALTHLEKALDAFKERTRKRVERGVEGTHEL